MKMERPRWQLVLLVLSAALGLAACSGGDGPTDAGAAPVRVDSGESQAVGAPDGAQADPSRSPEPTADPASAGLSDPRPGATTKVAVYLLDGEALQKVERTVAKVPGVGAEAVRTLLTGPTPAERRAGLGTAIPGGTRLLGLSIEDGTATVDLSRAFESGGGTLGLVLRLAQVTCTLDEFETVAGVRFSVDGEVVDVFSGDGIVLDHPVTCSSYRNSLEGGAPDAGCEDIGTFQGCPTHGGPAPGSPEDCAGTRPAGPCKAPGATLECQNVAFTPDSEDAASSIRATGLPCAEAEAFVGIAGRQTSSGGPQQVDVEGYRCILVRSDQEPLPQAYYECTNGSKTVTFVRT
jgi:hypothetical protein